MMTGKPTFRYNLLNEEIQLSIADGSFWMKILDFAQKGFLLGGGTLPEEEIPKEYKTIAGQHAYAILDAFELDGNQLLLLKDPRGSSDWVGEWSAGSKRWTSRLKEMAIQQLNRAKPRKDQKKCTQAFIETQGQSTFFVSWEEFVKCFEVIFAFIFLDNWNEIKIRDEWKEGCAGGSIINIESVLKSPQYLLVVPKDVEIFCILVRWVNASERELTKIGFEIYKYNGKLIGESEQIPDLVAIGRYSAERSITLNCVIEKGEYLVLISTYKPNEYGAFSFTLWYPKNGDNIKLKLTKIEAKQD